MNVPDDRITCLICKGLDPRTGFCLPQQQGKMRGAKFFKPDTERLRRCPCYQPHGNDQDQRSGLQRWPGLRHPGMRGLQAWMPST